MAPLSKLPLALRTLRHARRVAVGMLIGVAVLPMATVAWLSFAPEIGAPSVVGFGGMALAAPILAMSNPEREIFGAEPWLNTPPLRLADLRGKVALVNFWTYSCINSLRPMPYIRAWAAKYKDRGLVVIGVHTPEFGFEQDIANVSQAVADQGIGYPVVLDSQMRIWRAFNNEDWPAFYFIGADGRVRGHMSGEGDYDKSERLIQKLLSEAGGSPVADHLSEVAGIGVQAAPDFKDIGSEETYVGYERATGFASPGGVRDDAPFVYRQPTALPLNRWSLSGTWTIGSEFATLNGATGAVAFHFQARDLHLIMGPAPGARPIRFRVRVDGAAPGADHGFDVDADGEGILREPRMYQLVRQSRAVRDRVFEIEFLDTGARAYDFTFG
jgi:thiol-disulfide isomerase/thioredoxin